MKKEIKKIAVFTSGGDAPGMNAAIRATVRGAYYHGISISAIYAGYKGMIEGDFEDMSPVKVSNIIQRGGTILQSARSKEFMTKEGRMKAHEQLLAHDIDGLIAIGGDGTFNGAHALYEEYGIPYVLIPGTIDNDLNGSDYTIGYDTATNTALEAIDKIRDTALSHNRIFFIEVMGRDAGDIAIRTGIACGAVSVIIPEKEEPLPVIVERLEKSLHHKSKTSLVIVAESGKSGLAIKISKEVSKQFPEYETKVTILGHLQRGGAPSCSDRVLASRLGVAAVDGLLKGQTDVIVGSIREKIEYTSFDDAMHGHHKIPDELFRVSEILRY